MDHARLPRLAVVVVNYGSHVLLAANLVQVAREVPSALIVVVDNFTTEAERQAVRDLGTAEKWTTVLLDTNTGFGGGMNRGVDAARDAGAGAFLLLNPDAHLAAASINALRRRSAADPMALISPRVVTADGRPWFSGADLYLRDGMSRATWKRSQHPGERTQPWLSGACLIIDDQLWSALGGFDEEYFLYWEDVDLSFRAVTAGGRLIVADDAVAVHDEGGTHEAAAQTAGRGKSTTYYYYNVRNRLLFAARHLAPEDRRRWVRGALPAALGILLQGGRRQFSHPVGPLSAALRGTQDGLRLVRKRPRSTAGD